MYYCLVSSHDDCGDGCHRLFCGTLTQIGRKLRSHCYENMREAIEEEDLDLEELEDEYDCDLDSYMDLVDNDDPTEGQIRDYDFDFSGARTCVIALTTTYADLVDAFNAYAADSYLCEWRMLPGDYVSPSTLRKVDSDLVMIGSRPSRYFARVEE